MMQSVLIVDDEEPIREAICLLLEDDGYVCVQAADGEQALQILRASTDRMVVLLDLMMPRMSGRDVLNTLAADPALAERHAFIMLTAADKTLPLALVQTLQRLDIPIVGKPFEIDHLLAAVRQAVDRLVGGYR